MGMLQEFKEFAVKGNAVDMAVGIITGAAFGKIVSSMVDDVIMPPIGFIIGGVDFKHIKLTLREAQDGAAAVTVNVGNFIQTIVDFTIIAFAVFLLVKFINKLKRREEAKTPAAPPMEVALLTEIRDLLKDKKLS